MNKPYLIFLFILTTWSLNAQTVTSNWFHKPGDAYSMLQADFANVNVPTTGIGQVWDFSDSSAEQAWNYSFVDPEEMSTFSEFPDATVARYGLIGSDPTLEEIFFKVTPDTVYYFGVNVLIAPGVPIFKIRTIPDQKIPFPLKYGDSYTQEIQSLVSITEIPPALPDTTFLPGDTFVTTFAGIGDVITPNGVFEDCVMIIDSIVGVAFSSSYSFYKGGFSNQIAEYSTGIDANTGTPFYSVEYRDTSPLISSTKDITENNLELNFEGKVNNVIKINSELNFNAHCQLISLDGRLIQMWNKEFTPGDNNLELMNDLQFPGLYAIFIYNKDTGQFISFKFFD